MPQFRWLFVLLFSILFLPAHGDTLADIYTGSVPVPDRSQASFRQGMNEALLQVLVKASAEPVEKIRRNPALADELANAERFAAQFLYRIQADPQLDGSTRNQIYLQAGFPEKIIMGLLRKGKLRFWSAQRSPVLVLPVIYKDGVAQMAGSGQTLASELVKAGKKYGIPLVVDDAGQQSAGQLWQGDAIYIRQLMSAQNQAYAVLIKFADSGSRGQWQLFDAGEPVSMQLQVDNPAVFADQGMAWLAGQLAGKSAVELGAAAGKIELVLEGADSYEKYEAAQAYLQGISIIDTLELLKIRQGALYLRLHLRAGSDQLEKVFQTDRRISLSTSADGKKTYHWNE